MGYQHEHDQVAGARLTEEARRQTALREEVFTIQRAWQDANRYNQMRPEAYMTPRQARLDRSVAGLLFVVVMIFLFIGCATGLIKGPTPSDNPLRPNPSVTFAPNRSQTGAILRENPISPGGGCYGCPSFGPGSEAE